MKLPRQRTFLDLIQGNLFLGRAQHGGTWYRGVWRDAKSLGVSTAEVVAAAPRSVRAFPTMQGRRPRARVLTYNVGGMGADLFDVFVDWLRGQSGLDIIVLEETHWGMGRGEAQWSRDGWHFVSTSSEDNRYAGLCVCISAKIATVSDIDFQVWTPGRLLHVRVHGKHFPIDVIAVYQWVDQGLAAQGNLQPRARIWEQLSRVLDSLPRRNVLALAGDLNSVVRPTGAHVGHGVHRTARQPDEELEQLLHTHDLCALNSWKSAKPEACCTFRNGTVRTQIDYIITRRAIVDPQARASGPIALDLTPWRQGRSIGQCEPVSRL